MSRIRNLLLFSTLAIALVSFASPTLAGGAGSTLNRGAGGDIHPEAAIGVNGGWLAFIWNPNIADSPFTYSAAETTMVRVTDGFCYGDQFSVDITPGGSAPPTPGSTTAPGSNVCGGPSDPDAAYNDPLMSSGCWFVDAGDQSVALGVLLNPHGSGGAWIRVDTTTDPDMVTECQLHGTGPAPPVPELGTLALVAAGVLGLVVLARRRA